MKNAASNSVGLEPERAGDAPHMPEVRADPLSHADPVSRVPGGGEGIIGVSLQVVGFHALVILEPATGENDGAPGPDLPLFPAVFQHGPDDRSAPVRKELLCRGGV